MMSAEAGSETPSAPRVQLPPEVRAAIVRALAAAVVNEIRREQAQEQQP